MAVVPTLLAYSILKGRPAPILTCQGLCHLSSVPLPTPIPQVAQRHLQHPLGS